MLKLIILDFDGVIVESTDIKTEAFRKLFSNVMWNMCNLLLGYGTGHLPGF